MAAFGEDLAAPKPLLLAPCLGTMRLLKSLNDERAIENLDRSPPS
jgi:hypothetical protein